MTFLAPLKAVSVLPRESLTVSVMASVAPATGVNDAAAAVAVWAGAGAGSVAVALVTSVSPVALNASWALLPMRC